MTGTMAALIGLATILTILTFVWVLSLRLQDASVADVGWGLGFVLLAWLYCLLSPTLTPRSWLVAVLTTLWGGRLAWHIFRRNHGNGEDPLLAAVRAAQPAALTAVDAFGVFVFAVVGFAFEVVGDRQLRRFRADPSNRGQVLDRGLWWYTRHPNYFGDAALSSGLYAIAAATPGGWLTVLSPALMTFPLMRVSGVTLLERSLTSSKPGYRAYIARTPAFFPWLPRAPR